MKVTDTVFPDSPGAAAAAWFVTMNAERVDPATEQAFLAWLRRSSANESHYESIEALQALTVHLRDDADVAWAFRESEVLAKTGSTVHASRIGLRFARHLPEFGVAVIVSLALAVLLTQDRDAGRVVAHGLPRALVSDTPPSAITETDTESAVIAVPAPESQAGSSADNPVPTADESAPVASDIDVALEIARGRLAGLRTRFTDAHPDVQAILLQIEGLERQRQGSVVNEADDVSVR